MKRAIRDPVDDALGVTPAVLPKWAAERAVKELVLGTPSDDADAAAGCVAGRRWHLDGVTVGTADRLVHAATLRLDPDNSCRRTLAFFSVGTVRVGGAVRYLVRAQ